MKVTFEIKDSEIKWYEEPQLAQATVTKFGQTFRGEGANRREAKTALKVKLLSFLEN